MYWKVEEGERESKRASERETERDRERHRERERDKKYSVHGWTTRNLNLSFESCSKIEMPLAC